jgi:hypothetical protein
MKFGTAKLAMEMPKAHQDQLWEGVRKVSMDLFWQVNLRLVHSGLPERSIPLRVFLPDCGVGPPLQKCISPTAEGNMNMV